MHVPRGAPASEIGTAVQVGGTPGGMQSARGAHRRLELLRITRKSFESHARILSILHSCFRPVLLMCDFILVSADKLTVIDGLS